MKFIEVTDRGDPKEPKLKLLNPEKIESIYIISDGPFAGERAGLYFVQGPGMYIDKQDLGRILHDIPVSR